MHGQREKCTSIPLAFVCRRPYNVVCTEVEGVSCIAMSARRKSGMKNYNKEGGSMDKYTCIVCGYVYDPAEGDSASGIAPGTAFEDLPDSWVCPVCGAPKTEFEKAG